MQLSRVFEKKIFCSLNLKKYFVIFPREETYSVEQ
jgi:hypothetical protein